MKARMPYRAADNRRRLLKSMILVAFFVTSVAVMPAGAAPCPKGVRFDVDASSVDVDVGWAGAFHDVTSWGGLHVTARMVACDGTTAGTCRECTLDGPVRNSGGIEFDNRRCRGATDMRCAGDADCDPGDACVFFLGAPFPLLADGIIPFCVTTEITGQLSGRVDPDAGSVAALSIPFIQRVYGSTDATGDTPSPCPRCEADVCTSGPRQGMSCTANAAHPRFGETSFDCPPSPTNLVGELVAPRATLSTAVQARTLSDASPSCTAPGYEDFKCACDTCDDPSATPCATHADCVAIGATTCGGLRCINGPTIGQPCATNADCCSPPACAPVVGVPYCGRVGYPTQPNACEGTDAACIAASPERPEQLDDGVCFARREFRCTTSQRPCNSNADCDREGNDTCAIGQGRACFFDTDERASSSRTVTATGSASPPIHNSATIVLGSLACMAPVREFPLANIVNQVLGLPGLARMKFGKVAMTFTACDRAPMPGCRAARRARIDLGDSRKDAKDKLRWKITKGDATTKPAFGNPIAATGTDYELCLYDATGLIGHAAVPSGASCAGKPCWYEKPNGYLYRDGEGVNGGIVEMQLAAAAGEPSIMVKAKGAGIEMPDLGALSSPVTMQLVSSDGECWTAQYDFPPAVGPDAKHFKDVVE